jgi:hypothetical protein
MIFNLIRYIFPILGLGIVHHINIEKFIASNQ